MKISKYLGQRISITFDDGEQLNGKVVNYTIAGDNDPEEESIEFVPDSGVMKGQTAEIYEHEIKSITTLE